jgi:hypothetical protein
MLLAIVLEGPLSQYFFGEVEWISIAINSLFPPFFMLVIILFNKVPDEENTRRIFQRIVDILDADESFEKKNRSYSAEGAVTPTVTPSRILDLLYCYICRYFLFDMAFANRTQFQYNQSTHILVFCFNHRFLRA